MMHYAIYAENPSIARLFVDRLEKNKPAAELQQFQNKKGLLFAEEVLQTFLKEDQKHGNSILVIQENRSLRDFSSGEKRKALLDYLLSQQPDYLILDDPFDCLDAESVIALKSRLIAVSTEMPIIQLLRRKEDLLPFIEVVIQLDGQKSVKTITAKEFSAESASEENFSAVDHIPSAPVIFNDIPEVLVKLDEVSVNYEDQQILQNISWEVKKGEFWKVSGPNGSGKTTILSMIYGDNPKAYGVDLYLFGNKKGSGESVWEIKKKIGYFSPALTELFSRRNTALEMLVSGMVDSIGLYQKPTDAQLKLAKEWLIVLQLENREKKAFTDLPVLEQRLLLIARAIIKHPPLLILDEPTTALDDESAGKIIRLINLISEQSRTAIIYVSHRIEKGLKPDFLYKLIPTQQGSVGEAETMD